MSTADTFHIAAAAGFLFGCGIIASWIAWLLSKVASLSWSCDRLYEAYEAECAVTESLNDELKCRAAASLAPPAEPGPATQEQET